ncbi:hypothetical protein jhhlp_001136 [Lomentospora prolificans]|uniref:LIM zinc-binding domain-containing protein n=1 Tax=Lomentospora prolificans TaxID=41688 RepID=A0A2N3NHM1_9PEZI|nr:hypothetical protein jhhlp_001136 [Lomentospora prolificans]
MFARGRAKEGGRKVTPPSPTYMTNDQFASYLADLRKHRNNRQSDSKQPPSRPLGPRERLATRQGCTDVKVDQRQSSATEFTPLATSSSIRSRYSVGPNARDYYPNTPVAPLKASDVVPTSTYIERGHRWMEKEEACSLRQAMEDMELRDQPSPNNKDDQDDQRIYEAALNEASELVWQHQHGIPSEPEGPYRYRPHLRKNSYAHARTASVGLYGDEIRATGLARDTARSVSGSSTESTVPAFSTAQSDPTLREVEGDRSTSYDRGQVSERDSIQMSKMRRGASGGAPHPSTSRRSSARRNISGEIGNPFSVDQIWEEPESLSTGQGDKVGGAAPVLSARTGNPLQPPAGVTNKPKGQVSAVNIHLNPPSRSRDPQYTTNSATPRCNEAGSSDSERKLHGVEIRAEDIRQATSMRLRDRSEKLHTPTAVSDDPNRPIVSFDARWSPDDQLAVIHPNLDKAKSEVTGNTPVPTVSLNARTLGPLPDSVAPAIIVSNDSERERNPGCKIKDPCPAGPSIMVDDIDGTGGLPSITIGSEGPRGRPLPNPQLSARRRAPRPPVSQSSGTTLCHECGHPLQGRFVALMGSTEKFHPQCLVCFVCGTSLEALEISPEPESFRKERLERISRRLAGEVLEEHPGKTMAEDGDDRLRFYCHLDWHELFAPKCKHCKTSILGEHIVALGEHWHFGHFFCAECGDPFEHGMTHIEKDGYAWCIGCQTKRTERKAPKCKKCKTAVVGHYIQALGGEWHDACFLCAYCEGTFYDGQIFPKEGPDGSLLVLCTRCRACELKQ